MLVLSRKEACFSLQSFPDELQFCTPVYRQRKSFFLGFHPPTCSSSSLEVFNTHSKPSIKWFQCVVMLREGRDPDEANGWGIHDCHHFFSLWLTCKVFQQDKWTTFNSRQFLNEKAVKNQNKYFYIWLQRLTKVVLYWSPESILRRHLKDILSAAEQYLLMKLL